MKSQPIAIRTRLPSKTRLACALAACLMVQSPLLLAQSTAATVRGQVSTTAGPASSAKVTATNLATGFTRSVQSGSGGAYALDGLPPGTYRIDATADGQTTSRTVVLQVGQTATLPLAVGSAAPTQLGSVVVRGEALPETTTSEVATYVTPKQIEALPQGTRNFLAFADTVPGMQFSTDANGNTRLRSGAQTSSAINVFIDGVGQKNYVLPGGITGQDTSRGNPFPQSAIGEYKVITQNYKAEYDQLSSAAIVAVTRSGSNKFTGSAFFDYTDTDMRSSSVFEERNDNKAVSKEEQYGISFGGPIVADRSHFFLAYEAKEYNSPVTFNLGNGYTIGQLPPAFQDDYGSGVYTRPFKEDLWFGKVDWLFGEAHYFELTAKYRKESELIQIGGQDLPSHGTDNTNDETRVDLRYQYTFGDWLNDAHLTYEKAFWAPRPQEFSNGYVASDGEWYRTIARIGGGENYQDKGQKGSAFQDDLTFRGWDDHTIKMGLKYKSVTVDTLEQNKFNPQFFYDIHESLTIPTHVEFGFPVSALGDGTVTSKNKQFGIYIQDDWQATDRLILNLGLRWDVESTPSFEDYVTPADVVAALQASSANKPGSGVNVADYISTGNNRSSDKNNWAPRIGFSYDTKGDQRHVVFGGIGRSYDRNLFDYLQLETSKGSWGNFAFDFNTPAHPCNVGVNNCRAYNPALQDPDVLRALGAASGGREVFLTDNDLTVPYSDQFSIGMRNIFPLAGIDWTSEVTLSRVESHDGFVFLLGNRRPDGSFFPNPGDSDPSPFGQGFAPFGNMILGTNGQETHANSVLFRLDKPFTDESPWGVTIAYTYTNAEQNSNINGSPFALNQPNLEGYGWFPALVPENRLVATGIWEGPWDITFSTKLSFASALPRYIQDCNEDSWSKCHFTSYTPDEDFKQVDLAASKEFEVFGDVRLRFRADLLNVFNWDNYSGYDDWRGAPNEPLNPNFGVPNAVQFPTRTLKLSVGIDW
jgi:hypothetical protein